MVLHWSFRSVQHMQFNDFLSLCRLCDSRCTGRITCQVWAFGDGLLQTCAMVLCGVRLQRVGA